MRGFIADFGMLRGYIMLFVRVFTYVVEHLMREIVISVVVCAHIQPVSPDYASLALILSKLPETLDKLGIKPFGEPGDTFDPSLHNAVRHAEDEAFGEGEIVEVLQQGYKYGEKVIRYAIVKVAN